MAVIIVVHHHYRPQRASAETVNVLKRESTVVGGFARPDAERLDNGLEDAARAADDAGRSGANLDVVPALGRGSEGVVKRLQELSKPDFCSIEVK